MADVRGGKVTETKTSRKTVGSGDLPGTVNPAASDAYNNTNAPFNHDGNDVSKYVGVSSEYRTYGDVRNKPLGTAADLPDFLPETLSAPEGASAPESLPGESVPVEDTTEADKGATAASVPAPAKPSTATKTGDSKK